MRFGHYRYPRKVFFSMMDKNKNIGDGLFIILSFLFFVFLIINALV